MGKATGPAVTKDMVRRAENARLSATVGAVMANERQVGGNHYAKAIQPWDYIVENKLGYLEGNIVKYVSRHKDKNGLEDLHKARHYLDKLIEVEQARAAEKATMPELRLTTPEIMRKR
jgi:hypothetical protein